MPVHPGCQTMFWIQRICPDQDSVLTARHAVRHTPDINQTLSRPHPGHSFIRPSIPQKYITNIFTSSTNECTYEAYCNQINTKSDQIQCDTYNSEAHLHCARTVHIGKATRDVGSPLVVVIGAGRLGVGGRKSRPGRSSLS